MKNLKKVLAFTLVVCMMLSTIVSATAISATDFSDYETIANAGEVAVLTELGVINGYPTGDFKPTKTVSRAEMAKMITVILNKGTDAAGNYDGAQVFSDVWADMWCKGYINYCNTLGIVVGMGDGTYKPNQGVTVVQTAKMLLVAMGYDPVVEGFEGANWDVKVNAIAAQVGLYNGVKANASAECSRDTAALIIYNALVANTVDGYVNGKAVVGEQTMLGKYFNSVVVSGVVVANDYANLFGTSALYNAKYNSTELAVLGSQYVDDNDPVDPGLEWFDEDLELSSYYSFVPKFSTSYVNTYGNSDYYESQIFQIGTTLEQVGQTVKVVAKLKDNYEYYYKNSVRYAEYVFTGEVIGTVMDVDCVVKEIDGEYNLFNTSDLKKEGVVLDKNTRYFMNYAAAWYNFGVPSRYDTLEDLYDTDVYNYGFYVPAIGNYSGLWNNIFFNADGTYSKFIDADGDGITEIVLQWRPTFAVAEYDSFYKTYTFDSGDLYIDDIEYFTSAYRIDPENIVCDVDLSDGDKILYVHVDGTYYVEVCESLKVTPDTVGIDSEDRNYVKVDGTTYYESGLYWSTDVYYNSNGYGQYDSTTKKGTGDGTPAGYSGPKQDYELYWNLYGTEPDDDYIFYFDSYGNVVAYEEDKGPPTSKLYAAVSASFVNYNTSSKRYDYTLELTKGGASKTGNVDVQRKNSRSDDIAEVAKPLFALYNQSFAKDVYVPDGTTANDYNTYYPSSWWSTSTGLNSIFYVDHPDSRLWVAATYDTTDPTIKLTDAYGELGVYGSKNFSLGRFTALIEADYDDDGDVDVDVPGTIVEMNVTSVDAAQRKYDGYTANADTVFFIYEYHYDDVSNSFSYTVRSFTGYKYLPAIEAGVDSTSGDWSGITAMYGVVDKDVLTAVVIETNADVTYTTDKYGFITRFISRTGSGSKELYYVEVVWNDGEITQVYLDAYESDVTYGTLTRTMYAMEECACSTFSSTDKEIYHATNDDNMSYLNYIETAGAKEIGDGPSSEITFVDNSGYYVATADSAFYYYCAVESTRSNVYDYVLVKTDAKNLFAFGPPGKMTEYAESYIVYYKNTVKDGEVVREIIAAIAGYDNPIGWDGYDFYEYDLDDGYYMLSSTTIKDGSVGQFASLVDGEIVK